MRMLDIASSAISIAGAVYRAYTGQWSIFDASGNRVLVFDTFFSLESVNEGKVTQSPVEEGSFVSYNKQISPTKATVVLGYTGLSMIRAAILNKCKELAAGTELVSITTPDRTFLDMSLVSYDYTYKAEKGVDRLLVTLDLEEIRQVSPEYTQTKMASNKNKASASTSDSGKTAPQKPKQSTLHRAGSDAGLWGPKGI